MAELICVYLCDLWIAMTVLARLIFGCYPTGTNATSTPITTKSTTNGTNT